MSKGLVVAAVQAGSIAEEMEIEAGDRILKVNNREIQDIIDFQFEVSDEEYTLFVEKSDGEQWELEIEKGPGEFLGLELEAISADGLKLCHNNCIFCFVAQMPKGMRRTLYVKDDDYRLSLTQGSFMTLTNLSEKEMKRIISLHLGPLYISVHAWDPEVRSRLMKNQQAKNLPQQLKRLSEAGIMIHAQIVLLPDHNDGEVLVETVQRLGELASVQSIAVVPVGLTRYRERLAPLRGFTSAEASWLIDKVAGWQKDFFVKRGVHLVYLADEFYVLAGREFPRSSVYDDFPQLENGIGMARKFITEIEKEWDYLPREILERHVHLVTGTSARNLFEVLRERLEKRIRGLTLIIHVIRNDFFGPSVTCAGLLTAQDIASQLGDLKEEDFLIPQVMLKSDEDRFLDDRSVSWLEEKVNGRAYVVQNEGLDFLEHVIGYPLEVERLE